jgi:hypothetical protein
MLKSGLTKTLSRRIMKTIKRLSPLLAVITLSLGVTACTTISEDELILVPETSTENIPTLEDGLKVGINKGGEAESE